ncbi:toll/interleukin-1 receptor domain-containing protein [Glaciecola sp. 1036]|uniref:toll/interleukin-1 receptor domain-containing protein n=1 Tax=Alteromonadaceae TaxID=72275 RepID=UPI003D06C983
MPSSKDQNTVFISYSRQDIELAEQIRHDLNAQGFNALFDKYDIAAGEDWQTRLSDMIASANSVLFLISPESIKSHVCSWEVDESERLAKRIFPVILKDTELDLIPGRLQRINFTFLNQSDIQQREFDRLVQALKSDQALVREHTRLTQAAYLWDNNGRNPSYLLRADAIARANQLLKNHSHTSLEISDLLSEFLDASLAQEEKDRNFKRTIIQRSFVQPAQTALEDGKFDSALRKIAAGAILSDDPNLTLEENAHHTEKHALWRSAISAASEPTLVQKIFYGASEHLGNVQLSDDETKVLGYSYRGQLFVWDIQSCEICFALQPPLEKINKALLLEDNRSLLVAGESGVVRVWDIETKTLVSELTKHEEEVKTFTLSADKMMLASGGRATQDKRNNDIKVWGMRSQKLLAQFPLSHTDGVDKIQFNADSAMLVSTSSNHVLLHDLADSESMKLPTIERALEHLDKDAPNIRWYHSHILTHLIHETYQLIVLMRHICLKTKKKAMTIQIWDISSGELLCTNTLRNISFTSAQMLLDESHLVAPVEGEYLGVFEVETGKLVNKLMVNAEANSTIKQSKCQQFLFIGTADRIIHLFDLKANTCVAEYKGHTGPVTDLALSKRGNWFVSSAGVYVNASVKHQGESEDNTVRMWSINFPKPKNVFNNTNDAWALSVSECGSFISAGYPKVGVLTKDLSDNEFFLLKTPKGFSGPYNIVTHPKYETLLLDEGRPHNILLCIYDDEPEFETLQQLENTSANALCKGAQLAAFADQDGNIQIQDVSNKRNENYRVHDVKIENLHFNDAGTHLVSIDVKGRVAIKQINSSDPAYIFETGLEKSTSICINNQVNRIVVVNENKLLFYCKQESNEQAKDAKESNWQQVVELTEHVNFFGGPVSVAFHPKGYIAATGSVSIDQVYLWDVQTGAKLATFSGHKRTLSLAISPNGKDLYVGSENGVLQWDISSFGDFDGNRLAYLSKFLDNGRDKLSYAEKQDLLMKNTPSPLLDELKKRL